MAYDKKEKERQGKVKADVMRLYLEKMPRLGPELDTWIDEQELYYKVHRDVIEFAVSLAQRSHVQQRMTASMSVMQQAMEIMPGMTFKALKALDRALDAKTRTPLKSGREFEKDENGGIMYAETPDYRAQLMAVDTVMKIQGGYAPKQIEIEQHNTHELKVADDAELTARLSRIFDRRRIVDVAFNAITGSETGSGGVGERVGDGRSLEGPLLLAHDDDGDD